MNHIYHSHFQFLNTLHTPRLVFEGGPPEKSQSDNLAQTVEEDDGEVVILDDEESNPAAAAKATKREAERVITPLADGGVSEEATGKEYISLEKRFEGREEELKLAVSTMEGILNGMSTKALLKFFFSINKKKRGIEEIYRYAYNHNQEEIAQMKDEGRLWRYEGQVLQLALNRLAPGGVSIRGGEIKTFRDTGIIGPKMRGLFIAYIEDSRGKELEEFLSANPIFHKEWKRIKNKIGYKGYKIERTSLSEEQVKALNEKSKKGTLVQKKDTTQQFLDSIGI